MKTNLLGLNVKTPNGLGKVRLVYASKGIVMVGVQVAAIWAEDEEFSEAPKFTAVQTWRITELTFIW